MGLESKWERSDATLLRPANEQGPNCIDGIHANRRAADAAAALVGQA